jgi:protein SCO1/2
MKSLFFPILFPIVIAIGSTVSSPCLAQVEAPTPSIFDETLHWKDDTGSDVQLSKWKGKRLVLTMSYTSCTKICNELTLKELKDIQNHLDKKGEKAEFLIFTFDPENDTPSELAAYRKRMKLSAPNWHYLVGNDEDTHKISKVLGLDKFWKMDDHMIHDFRILVVNASGQTEQVLDWDHRKVDF